METDQTRVLVIEDDPKMQATLVMLLEAEGYFVKATDRGEDAIALAGDFDFDVLVADIRTEGMSGLDAIEEVQKRDPGVQSLVVTGYSSEEESIRAIRLGVKEYFKKPFRLQDFLESVRTLAAVSKSQKAARQKRRALEESLLWALSFAADCLNKNLKLGETLPLRAIDELAQGLGLAHGLSEDSIRAAKISCLVQSMSPVAGTSPELSSYLERVARHLDECWDGSGGPEGLQGPEIPVESRLGSLVLASAQEPELRAQDLAQKYPGRFDPGLLETLATEQQGEKRSVALQGPEQRGLLRLGRAMEEIGNLLTAGTAYQQVRQSSEHTRERVHALRGLARIAVREGRDGEASELLEEGLQAAQAVGPMTAADCLLETGLLLQRLGRDSVDCLRKALRLFEQGGLEASHARALWALYIADQGSHAEELDQALKVLNRPEHVGELVSCTEWLFPCLLSQGELSEERTQVLQKLILVAPRSLSDMLLSGQFSLEQRRRLLEHLAKTSGPSRDRLLQLLSRDENGELSESARRCVAKSSTSDAPPVLRVFSMGPLEVYKGDSAVLESEWKTRKIRYLFAQLAYRRGRPISEDILIETQWPDSGDKGKGSLYWASSILRKILRPAGWNDLDYILRNSSHLQLNPDFPRWHDVEELEDLIAAVRKVPSGERPPQLGPFRRSLDLYRGPFLENCYLDWALAVRSKLEQESISTFLQLAQWSSEEAGFIAVQDYSAAVLEIDNCNQAAYLESMKAAISLGQPELAVRQFEKAEQVLKSQLQLEPNTALIEWKHRALLHQS